MVVLPVASVGALTTPASKAAAAPPGSVSAGVLSSAPQASAGTDRVFSPSQEAWAVRSRLLMGKAVKTTSATGSPPFVLVLPSAVPSLPWEPDSCLWMMIEPVLEVSILPSAATAAPETSPRPATPMARAPAAAATRRPRARAVVLMYVCPFIVHGAGRADAQEMGGGETR